MIGSMVTQEGGAMASQTSLTASETECLTSRASMTYRTGSYSPAQLVSQQNSTQLQQTSSSQSISQARGSSVEMVAPSGDSGPETVTEDRPKKLGESPSKSLRIRDKKVSM